MAQQSQCVGVTVLMALLGAILLLHPTTVQGKLGVQILTVDNFEQRVTSKGRWFVQFDDGWCEMCRIMTPKFRSVARQFKTVPGVYFGKFGCDKEYNENFCRVHNIDETPTYILFDEFSTFGHRFLTPHEPSKEDMAAWLQHALSVDNSTVSMPPGLTHHLDMSLDWHSEEKLAEQAAAQAEQEQEQGQEQGQQEQEPAIGDDSANAIEGSFTASIDAEGRTEL